MVAVVAAGFTLLAILGGLTLSNTNTTVNDVANAQANHSATLSHIDHLAKVDAAELAQLKAATLTVDRILTEAGSTSASLKASMAAICAAEPGCKPPG